MNGFDLPDMSDVPAADLSRQSQPVSLDAALTSIIINKIYQRSITPAGWQNIRRMKQNWDWLLYTPAKLAFTENGLEAIDGQHRILAAMAHGGITHLPCIVVDGTTLPDRARAFVSAARDQVKPTAAQIHRAEVVAGDERAIARQQVCDAAGITVVEYPPPNSAYKVRQSIAVAAIDGLVGRQGTTKATLVMTALANSDLAPVKALDIRVAETLLLDPEYATDFDVDRLAASFRALGPKAMIEAKELAAAKGLPMWRALVAVIYRHRKGRAPAASPTSTAAKPVAPPANPMRRIIDRTPPGGVVPLGEPPAGRSALDQRRARA